MSNTNAKLLKELRILKTFLSSQMHIDIIQDAIDRIEDQQNTIDTFIYGNKLLDNNPYRKKYINEWRKRNGKDKLSYPGGVQVYEDYFDLLRKLEEIRTNPKTSMVKFFKSKNKSFEEIETEINTFARENKLNIVAITQFGNECYIMVTFEGVTLK